MEMQACHLTGVTEPCRRRASAAERTNPGLSCNISTCRQDNFSPGTLTLSRKRICGFGSHDLNLLRKTVQCRPSTLQG